jgi:hypothetical protein
MAGTTGLAAARAPFFRRAAPKVREFLATRAFGKPVELEGREVIHAISSNVAWFVPIDLFVKALRALAVEEQVPQLEALRADPPDEAILLEHGEGQLGPRLGDLERQGQVFHRRLRRRDRERFETRASTAPSVEEAPHKSRGPLRPLQFAS